MGNLQLWAMPKAYFEKVGEEGFAKAPVGTGPWALLGSVLRPDPSVPLPVGVIHGEIGSAMAPPPGCKFHPRCPQAQPGCRVARPESRVLAPGHLAACPVAG